MDLSEKEKGKMKTELCRGLYKIGAINFGAFKLTSGKVSPYYVDLRIVPSFPDVFNKICGFYYHIITSSVGEENFDRIAGIPVTGIPFASVVASNLNKPFLYVRKDVRLHGRERRVEGILMPGDRVLLLDDLITTGKSLSAAARIVSSEGGLVDAVVVLIDREENGEENLSEEGISLHYLLKMSEAARILYEIEAISEDQYKTILGQIK